MNALARTRKLVPARMRCMCHAQHGLHNALARTRTLVPSRMSCVAYMQHGLLTSMCHLLVFLQGAARPVSTYVSMLPASMNLAAPIDDDRLPVHVSDSRTEFKRS